MNAGESLRRRFDSKALLGDVDVEEVAMITLVLESDETLVPGSTPVPYANKV